MCFTVHNIRRNDTRQATITTRKSESVSAEVDKGRKSVTCRCKGERGGTSGGGGGGGGVGFLPAIYIGVQNPIQNAKAHDDDTGDAIIKVK